MGGSKRGATAVFLMVALVAGVAFAQVKPLTEKALVRLIELGTDDAKIIANVEKNGVGFTVDDEALQRLKDAGASDDVVQAVQKSGKAKSPAGKKEAKAVSYQDVLELLESSVDEETILGLLARSPTIFTIGAAEERDLKKAGASAKVIAAMKGERPSPSQSAEITDIAIILDCSGSMKEHTRDRKEKMVVAKKTVADLIQKIPNGINLCFIVYGHEVFGDVGDPRNCKAVKIVRPLKALDDQGKAELASFISKLQPRGATPIALALRTAGEELAKNNAFCGLVLITDGLETCKGDPAAEAAALARNGKLTFGLHLVGFDVNDKEDAALKEIVNAAGGRGKYYDVGSAAELADQMNDLAKELEGALEAPVVIDTSRRALRVLSPRVEMPEMTEITLWAEGEFRSYALNRPVASVKKYGDYLAIPSPTKKYDVVWKGKSGEGVLLLHDFTLPERKVVDLRPETVLGFVQVGGKKTINRMEAFADKYEANFFQKATQWAEKYGQIMVLPAGDYDIVISDADGKKSLLEEGLTVEAGKLYKLE